MKRLVLFGALTGCSLVFGLYDNKGPLDGGTTPDAAPDVSPDVEEASVDAPMDVGPESSPGCPPGVFGHAFCEYFDETPSWPDAGILSPSGTLALSSSGCTTSQPHCLSFAGGTGGSAGHTLPWTSSNSIVTMDWQVRIDSLSAGCAEVGRVGWVHFNTSAVTGGVDIGATFCQGGGASIFLFWASNDGVGNLALVQANAGSTWYHLRLSVDIAGQQATLNQVGGTVSPASANYATMQLPSAFNAASISSVSINVGGENNPTGGGNADTVDTLYADLN